jgi:hypothetical protein
MTGLSSFSTHEPTLQLAIAQPVLVVNFVVDKTGPLRLREPLAPPLFLAEIAACDQSGWSMMASDGIRAHFSSNMKMSGQT